MFIHLIAEDKETLPNQVGRLHVCLYGTRDAAKGWQQELTPHLVQLGFKHGRGHPAVFHHPGRGILTLVHGDDYVSSGPRASSDWLDIELNKKYKVETQRFGDDVHELKVLNRILRRTQHGFEVEADPRHAELIIEEMLEGGLRTLSTPGVDEKEKQEEEDIKLEGEQVRTFRSISARCNYLSQDRPDLLYPVKEICREMATPTKGSWRRLQRVAAFLKGKPRLVWTFPWQDAVEIIDVMTDANWVGCRRTRKSTSGGAILLGKHCIKAWANTQAVVARSSGESELYSVVRASCEALGTHTLMRDFGITLLAQVHVDASVAKRICEREGIDRIRRLDVSNVWLQAQQVREKATIIKMRGQLNCADLMTKHLAFEDIEINLEIVGLPYREGRAQAAAQLYVVDSAKTELDTCNPPISDGFRRRTVVEADEVDSDDDWTGGENDGGTESKEASKSQLEKDIPEGKLNVNSGCARGGTVGDGGGVPDRWVNRWNQSSWVREIRRARRTLISPVGVARGPMDPYKELWGHSHHQRNYMAGEEVHVH